MESQYTMVTTTENRTEAPYKLLTTEELAERWGISPQTLCSWRMKSNFGKGPAFIKIGRRALYRLKDVEAFESNNRRAKTPE